MSLAEKLRAEGLEVGHAQGRKEGLEEGREVGREEGREVGREEGLEAGREVERQVMAKTMLAEGADPVFVVKVTGLTTEHVESLSL